MGQQVRAQRSANETNLKIAQDTNQMNYGISHEANDLNYQMFQEQNAWNREQWNLENEYNSPVNQVKRLQEAGINPIWGLGSADPGNASHLESAQSSPANVAQMQSARVEPEYGLEALSHVQAALNSVSNDVKDFYRLGIETEDMRTRQRSQSSQAALNRAEAMFKRSQTQGQTIFNNLNSQTYGVQVSTKVAELNRLNKEIEKVGVDSELGRSLISNKEEEKKQIIAQTKFIQTQTDGYLEQIAQGWKRLQFEQQNANTNSMNAETARFSARSDQFYKSLEFGQRQKEFEANMKHQTNSQLLEAVERQRGTWEKFLGTTFTEGYHNVNQEILTEIKAAGQVLVERVQSDPSAENVRAFDEYQKIVNSMNIPNMAYPSSPPNNFSIINPYD